ncbi:MAG: hypothetical protein J2P57_12370 [Acidimicrobiaceae bacterium]|nr:hypothetical protein [Acidimicrobiaceae bacterium]
MHRLLGATEPERRRVRLVRDEFHARVSERRQAGSRRLRSLFSVLQSH